MKTIGIDIGTTTISGVVLEKNETQKARILEAKTIENGSFLATDSDWERIQDAENIVKKSRQMLDDLPDRCMGSCILTKKEPASVRCIPGRMREEVFVRRRTVP